MHEEALGDVYVPDPISYQLTCELRVIVTEPMELQGGRGGHESHGEWWWADNVPADVVIEYW